MKRKEEQYQLVRFILTWTIVIHHILTTANAYDIPKPYFLTILFSRISGSFGQMAVAMFFMLSGALLWRNHSSREKLSWYYCNRIGKLLIPIWVCSVPLILLNYVSDPTVVCSDYMKNTIIYNLFGLDLYFWIFKDVYPYHVCGEWFTSIILTLYLIFPLLKILFSKKASRYFFTIIITIVFILNLKYKIMTMGNGWYSFSLGVFYFWIGMMFEEHKDRIDCNVCAAFAFICFAVVYLVFYSTILGSAFIPNVIASICSFIVLYRLGTILRSILKLPAFDCVIEETCSKSYLIYLCHHFLIELFMPLLLSGNSNVLQFYIFIMFTVMITYGFAKMIAPVTQYLIRQFTRKSLWS